MRHVIFSLNEYVMLCYVHRVKCQKGTYVTHGANVIVTGASDVDDVLVKRQS